MLIDFKRETDQPKLGVALGFLIPPIMVKDHEFREEIGHDLLFMFYIVAGICTFLLLTVIVGNLNSCLKMEIKI